MARSDQFFHGTRAALEAGDTLVPHNRVPGGGGRPNYEAFADHSRDRVFMAENDEAYAWTWAGMAGMALRGKGRRSAVLEVDPDHRTVQRGVAETTARSARVLKRHDIMPGKQGTFPLNWNQFAKEPARLDADVYNHPNDEQIAKGHNPDPGMTLETIPDPDPNRENPAKGQGVLF